MMIITIAVMLPLLSMSVNSIQNEFMPIMHMTYRSCKKMPVDETFRKYIGAHEKEFRMGTLAFRSF